MLNHVIVPLDGSSLAERALAYAQKIVDKEGTITLLSVIDVPEYAVASFYAGGIVAEAPNHRYMIEQMVPQTRDYLENVANSLRDLGYSVRIEAVIDEAAHAIVEKSESLKVDAIVMSTHGRSGFSRWLFGSITNKVLSSAPCPVFVIPSRKEEVNNYV